MFQNEQFGFELFMKGMNTMNRNQQSTELLLSFWHIQGHMAKNIQKTAQYNGLSMPQYSILLAMAHQEKMMQKKILQKTKLPKSTLSQAIDGLVQMGLLERKIAEANRREMQVVMSEKGKQLMENIKEQDEGIHHIFKRVVAELSPEQFEMTMRTHEHILTELKKGEAK